MTAYEWAIETCNKANVGYSQDYREEKTVNGITYYDCSSFIWYALKYGGIDVMKYSSSPFTTATMPKILLSMGFVGFDPWNNDWKLGDIMWRSGHTEMVYDAVNKITMGAHSARLPLAEQVSVGKSINKSWTAGYRLESQIVVPEEWKVKDKGPYNIDSDEAYNNALLVYAILSEKGWTLNAISAILGNIGAESGYNPWRWQSDIEGTLTTERGYGLVQFSPGNKYISDARAKVLEGYAPHYADHVGSQSDGTAQMIYVDLYADYYATSSHPLSYSEFKASTDTPEELAETWFYNYERSSHTETIPARQNNAKYWYNKLGGITPPPVPPTPPVKKERKGMPLWMMLYPWY